MSTLEYNHIFIYNISIRKNKNEKHITNMVNEIEKDLVKNNKSIDTNELRNTNNYSIRDFMFDYENIRTIIPHDQMPITNKDIDIYLIDWKSGKWMDILNSYPYELGYDWKKNNIKNLQSEMKRYQHDMLHANDKNLDNIVIAYLKTLSWVCDYYMNTDDNSTKNFISTWSFIYERSPFISHINIFLQNTDIKNITNIMSNVYNKSLVSVDKYLTIEQHRLYIYPISDTKDIPYRYHKSFPNMENYVKQTLNSVNIKNKKRKRLFDCRMCAYFSKCIFESNSLTYDELINIDKHRVKRAKINNKRR